ncbi:MAG: hypothetical protein NTW16_02505 [Bacteroidetes bacterium]|nr:hypothetical protein [Bacteroidota bacterium]
MKLKLHALCLIAAIMLVNLLAHGSNENDRKDTLNGNKILSLVDSALQQIKRVTVTCTPKVTPLIVPNVVKVGSFVKGQDSVIVFGDYIYVTIDNIAALKALSDSITQNKKDTMGDLILYINGNAMRDIGVLNFDVKEGKLVFLLDRHSKYLMKFHPEFPYLWSKIPVTVSAGFRNGTVFHTDPTAKPFFLKFVSRWAIVFSLLFVVSIVVIFVVLASTTNLIRIGDNKSPYSLALTQLSFWTIVVASSFIYIWIVTEEIPPITGSTLILISISALTTAGSRLVDIREKNKNGLVIPAISDSFLEDILQDELGYSVHRAQMFMWTVILGIIFVTSVIRFQQIPQLDESLLSLMGISSGAYVGLKTMENKKDPDPATPEVKNQGEVTTT